MQMPRARAVHFLKVLIRPSWAWLVVGFGGFAGTLALIRDELLSPGTAGQFKVLKMLPAWPWTAYLAASLFVLLVVMFEGSFRVARAGEAKIAGLQAEADALRLAHVAARKDGVVQQAVSAARVRLIEIVTLLRIHAGSEHGASVDGLELPPILAKLQPEERRAWAVFQEEFTKVHLAALRRRADPAPITSEEITIAFVGENQQSMNDAAEALINLLLIDG